MLALAPTGMSWSGTTEMSILAVIAAWAGCCRTSREHASWYSRCQRRKRFADSRHTPGLADVPVQAQVVEVHSEQLPVSAGTQLPQALPAVAIHPRGRRGA